MCAAYMNVCCREMLRKYIRKFVNLDPKLYLRLSNYNSYEILKIFSVRARVNNVTPQSQRGQFRKLFFRIFTSGNIIYEPTFSCYFFPIEKSLVIFITVIANKIRAWKKDDKSVTRKRAIVWWNCITVFAFSLFPCLFSSFSSHTLSLFLSFSHSLSHTHLHAYNDFAIFQFFGCFFSSGENSLNVGVERWLREKDSPAQVNASRVHFSFPAVRSDN